jgi:multicomponent Na+:H+ antiporter subunit F
MIPHVVLSVAFAGAIVLLLAAGLLLVRAAGTLHRIVALDVLGTLVILLLTTLSYQAGVSYYVDAALALALLSFTATLVAARYMARRRRPLP